MLICDTHCDVLWARAFHDPSDCVVTMENLARGGVSLQVLALFSGSDDVADRPYEVAMREMEEFRKLQRAGWEQVFSPSEAEEGKQKVMLSIEGGEILEGSVERVREFAGYGVRMAALTWNRENEIGYPAKSGEKRGIKPAGWTLLREMARLGIAADVSHLNEAGFWDLVDRHSQPPMASHSCCRSLCGHWRNLSDDQIRALVARGGWIGVNFYPFFLSDDGNADVRTLCDHIDHICQLGGGAHVGLGSDFDGIECAPRGLTTPAQLPAVFQELRRRGYSEEAVGAVAGKNFLAYYGRLAS